MRRILVATVMLLAMVAVSASSCGASCPAGKQPVYSPVTHATVCQ